MELKTAAFLEQKTDEELIGLLSDVTLKEKLFSILYRRHSKWVYNKALQFVGTNDVDDLTQIIFIKVFTQIASYKKQSKFSTWLYRITYNSCIDHCRKAKPGVTIPFDIAYADNVPGDEELSNEILQLKAQKLRETLEKIDPEEKLFLFMKYQDDKSIKEICEVTGLSEGAVKMRLRRSKIKVRKLYKDH